MVERGTRQHDAVDMSDCHCQRGSFSRIAEHPARGGAMDIEAVADSHLQSRNHVGLSVDSKTDVANERGVEQRIYNVAIVGSALGKALQPGARSHSDRAAPIESSRVSNRRFGLLFHPR